MEVILWCAIGSLAGSIAQILPGPKAGDVDVAIAIGIAGALVGGLISYGMPIGVVAGFDFRALTMAISGSITALVCYLAYAVRSHVLRQ